MKDPAGFGNTESMFWSVEEYLR